jgi:SAM-dependent methyltransferase
MKDDIEYTACNACGSTDCVVLFPDRALSPSGREGVVRCAQCGLVYRNIRRTPEAILQDYASRAYTRPADGWIAGRRHVFKNQVKKLAAYRQTGYILDVGAGHGFFLAACRDAGWQCRGIEPSLQCRTFADEQFGLSLSGELIHDYKPQGIRFDVITFWNVLDQLADPKKALSDARHLLRPGGAVIIRSPNAAFHVTVKRLLRGPGGMIPLFNRLDQTVFHLYSFDRHTIRSMLQDAGFIETRVFPAELSWTTAHNAKTAFVRKSIALPVERLAKGIFILTARHLLLAPSLLAVGRKPADD